MSENSTQAGMVLVPDEVRRLVGKLAQWRLSMSYNESYFGEPAGLVKSTVAALERIVDPIYPPAPVAPDPLAGVVIYTASRTLAAAPAASASAVDEGLASKVYDVLSGRNPPQRRHGYPDWKELSADCREEYVETAAALAVVFRPAQDAEDAARLDWLLGGIDRNVYRTIGGEWAAQDDVIGCWYGETPRAAIDAARAARGGGHE